MGLEQCLSYNRYLVTFVGWIKENIGRTFYLPDHLSQNTSFLLIILIMKSWPKGNVKTFLLKVWPWDVEQALEYIQKLPLQLYSREIWPLQLQKRDCLHHLNWQDITVFYNIKCKGYRECLVCAPPPPILQVGKLKFRGERGWPGQPGNQSMEESGLEPVPRPVLLLPTPTWASSSKCRLSGILELKKWFMTHQCHIIFFFKWCFKTQTLVLTYL